MMKVEEGMKCRFRCAYGTMCNNGIVLKVRDDGTFLVAEDMKCPAQYNDSYMDFTENDIGKRVFFDD